MHYDTGQSSSGVAGKWPSAVRRTIVFASSNKGAALLLGTSLFLAACGGGGQAAPASSGAAPAGSTAAQASGAAAPASAATSQVVKDLIAKANQEGSLAVETVDSSMPSADHIKSGFQQFFQPLGLKIDMQVGAGQQPAVWGQAQTAMATGTATQFDAMLGPISEAYPYYKDNLLLTIDNWQEVVKAVNPAAANGSVKIDDFSPAPITGKALLFNELYKVMLYNSNLSKDKLPKGYADMPDPKFKGRFVVPPWGGSYDFGILAYPKDKWLDLARQIGQSAASVQTYPAGIQQILSGSVDFQQDNLDDYFTQKALSPNAPVAYGWFNDLTAIDEQFYVIPAKAKHPAAATLFAAWATTDAARATWGPNYMAVNLRTGHLPQDEEVRKSLDAAKPKVSSFFADKDSLGQLDWLLTTDGQAYDKQLLQVVTRRG
jgi:ABC-type Fe3+ transport system substrate-binding protein